MEETACLAAFIKLAFRVDLLEAWLVLAIGYVAALKSTVCHGI